MHVYQCCNAWYSFGRMLETDVSNCKLRCCLFIGPRAFVSCSDYVGLLFSFWHSWEFSSFTSCTFKVFPWETGFSIFFCPCLDNFFDWQWPLGKASSRSMCYCGSRWAAYSKYYHARWCFRGTKSGFVESWDRKNGMGEAFELQTSFTSKVIWGTIEQWTSLSYFAK